MKRHAILITSAMLGLFSTASFAVTGTSSTAPSTLEQGVSDSRLVSSVPQRYRLDIEREGTLQISSDHLTSDSSNNLHIRGKLYDEQGHLISMADDNRGHFMIKTDVMPGAYTLKVTGSAMGSPDEVSHRYNLHMDVR